MSSEMVERGARALWDRQNALEHRDAVWELADADSKVWAYASARTVIEAMREPTEAMLTNAHVHGENHAREIRQVWADMIDEALK